MTIRPPAPTDPGVRMFYVLARAKPGVGVARQVKGELETLRADVRRAYPKLASAPRLRVTPFTDVLVGQARRSLLILFGCVLVVLTIACVNIASLQLCPRGARGAKRSPCARPSAPDVDACSGSSSSKTCWWPRSAASPGCSWLAPPCRR